MNDIEEWILKFVPKRTGQLRDSLLKNMESSRIKRGVLRFILGTHIDYAARVNKMSTKQVQHSSAFEHAGKARRVKGKKRKRKVRPKPRRAYAYYYGHYGKIFLDDPQAIGGFWVKLLTYLKGRIIFHMANAMRAQYGQTKLPWKIE